MKTIIIGAGSDLGVHIDGANKGPNQLLKDIKSFYEGETISLTQEENIIKSRNLADLRKNELEIEKFNTNLYNIALEKHRNDYFPITIGGDHSIAVATALANAKANSNIGIIWFDSHPDFNTFETTITGNIHGLPLAAITGYKNKDLTRYHDGNFIKIENAVIVGARSIDKDEKANLEDAGITVFTTNDIKEQGIESILEKAFKIAGNRTNGIHISYDLDLIDPSEAPGVSVPEYNGITQEEAIKINKLITEHIEEITSYDLVEFNPSRDINRKTEQIAVNLLSQIITAASKKSTYGKLNSKSIYVNDIKPKF